MTTAAFDTLKATQTLQEAGFSRKQAAGAVQVLTDVLSDYPRKDTVIEAIQEAVVRINDRTGDRIAAAEQRLGQRIDDLRAEHGAKLTALETGQAELRAGQEQLRVGQAELRVGQEQLRAEHGAKLAALEAGQEQLRVGQADLMENQLELRRELRSHGDLLAAIASHLGIPPSAK